MKYRMQWGEFPIPSDQPQSFEFGPLRLWCRYLDGDLWLAPRYRGEPESEDEPDKSAKEVPDEALWTRWALARPSESIQFSPALPDRPVVVRPERTLLVTPKARVRVYVRCPLWVRVDAIGGSTIHVEEVPSVQLSDTWYGTNTEGDLCYWISSSARRKAAPDPERPFLALCPIQIVNRDDQELKIERLCLRVPWLSLFESNGMLWSDATRIAYRGQAGPSEVEVSGKAPAEARRALLKIRPRQSSKSVIASTFANFTRGRLAGWNIFSG